MGTTSRVFPSGSAKRWSSWEQALWSTLGAASQKLQLWEVVIRKADLNSFLHPSVIADGFLNAERF